MRFLRSVCAVDRGRIWVASESRKRYTAHGQTKVTAVAHDVATV